MQDSQIIVVGAGIAGLTAAYQLQNNGVDVVVLEASSRVGGRMTTDFIDGYIIDRGAQFLSSAYPILSKLITKLELSSEYADTSPWVGVVRNGEIHKFRYDKPISLLFGGLLNFSEWLTLGLGSFKLFNRTKMLALNNYSAWELFDDETAEIWSDRYYGNNITNYFLEPMLEAFYFQAPEKTSKALAIALNAFSGHKAKCKTLISGIGRLPDMLGESLKIQLNMPVHKISIEDNAVTVFTEKQAFKANKVILATPAPITKKMYIKTSELENKLLSTEYSSTLNVAIALKRELPKEENIKNIYGIWIPKKERNIIAAFTIESEKNSGRVSTGELVNVMLSGKAGKTMINWEENDILSAILLELENYLPDISRNIAFTRVYRWLYAEPMSPVGRCSDIKAYRETIQGNNRVLLAGDYVGMPFTEGAAETGLWAASTILNMT